MDATEHLPPEHGGYLARNWRRKQAWGGSYYLDKVCHDFDIFGRLARARPARVASFGGRRIFHSGRADAERTYSDGSPAYAMRDAGWAGANDAFQSDMDVTDHQTALVEYESGFQLSFHSNSHVSLGERRWYIAGTEGTLLADLVRNTLMVRRAMSKEKPERIDFATRTSDNHNGADQAMAKDLLATLSTGAAFPVTPYESMEAGLTVMAIDRALTERRIVDCAPMWSDYDAARNCGNSV
jgi:predicted dehydrogenase